MSTDRERALVRKSLKDKGGDDVIGPGKFDPTDYVKWEKGLKNKLSSISGIKGVPIFYVTLVKDLADAEEILDKPFITKTVFLTPLIGTRFESDSQKVITAICRQGLTGRMKKLLMGLLILQLCQQIGSVP